MQLYNIQDGVLSVDQVHILYQCYPGTVTGYHQSVVEARMGKGKERETRDTMYVSHWIK